MRITSDCPLIDPAVCGALIARWRASGADYGSINMPPTWPHGLECEVFSSAWLERAAREAVKPSDREHVSPFIREHPEAVRVNMPGPGPQTVRHRWTLDHADDLTFLRTLWARLPEGRQGGIGMCRSPSSRRIRRWRRSTRGMTDWRGTGGVWRRMNGRGFCDARSAGAGPTVTSLPLRFSAAPPPPLATRGGRRSEQLASSSPRAQRRQGRWQDAERSGAD